MSEIVYVLSITEQESYRVLGVYTTIPKALDEIKVVWNMDMHHLIPAIEHYIEEQSYANLTNTDLMEKAEILAVEII